MFIIYGALAQLVSAFINWGLMMALLFNLVDYSNGLTRKRSPIWISLIICISYFSTSFVNAKYSVYGTYFTADLLTIALIYIISLRRVKTPAYYYCFLGLSANSLLHGLMYFDVIFTENKEPWWLWSVYSIGINVSDLIMILALIINRDFLGLVRGINFLKNKLLINKVRSYV